MHKITILPTTEAISEIERSSKRQPATNDGRQPMMVLEYTLEKIVAVDHFEPANPFRDAESPPGTASVCERASVGDKDKQNRLTTASRAHTFPIVSIYF